MKKFWANYNLYGKLNWLTVILTSILWLNNSSSALFAQQTLLNKYAKQSVAINSVDAAKAFILQQLPALNNNTSQLVFSFRKETNHATYYTFVQYYNSIPIQHTAIKIGITKRGDVLYISGNYYNTELWPSLIIPKTNSLTDNLIKSTFNLPENVQPKVVIQVSDDLQPVGVLVYDYQHPKDRSRISISCDANGTILATDLHRTYFSEADTTVTAKVFLPDPLTSAEVNYGGDYSDNDDLDNAVLNNERMEVLMQVQLENDTFFLRTDSLILKDLNSPTVPVVTSIVPSFDFLRSENGFEDVNVFYHITNMNNDVLAAGYEQLQNFYIEIDPHGASGGDLSFYVSAAIPSIQFGEGGVDDAEDADVIIHEYTHAISDQASPLSNSGIERRAIDEGYGDYFAASYSRKYSDYAWDKIFSWDGHNEFWFGRNADTDKHYPEDNSDNYYAASEIWSGALMDIFDLIGKEQTDKLVLEAMYGSFPNMTMPQAALLIVAAEEVLFSGIYYETVYAALQARGLLNPVDIQTATLSNDINFTNSAAFTNNNEPLYIQLKSIQPFVLNIYTSNGTLLETQMGKSDLIAWQAPLQFTGILIVEVITTNAKANEVVVKMKK